MKVDVFKLEQRYKNWKDEALAGGVPSLTCENSDILVQYVLDMEAGRNVARGSKKGGRGYAQLVNLQQRLKQVLQLLQKRGLTDVRSVGEQEITRLFNDMERGDILTARGTRYASVGDYVRVFKAFWHWWMKVNRKRGVVIPDLTEDLRVSRPLPRFVYLSKQNLDELLPYFDDDDQVVLLFLFDSLVRAPTELLSLRARHIYESDGEVWASVPDEVSKTFGRTFNLLYCGDALMRYVRERELGPDDPLFEFSPPVMNRKLKRVAGQVFGDRASHPQGDLYKHLTLYDFRHSGAIHLRLLAKENPGLIGLDAIRHRGGWSDFNMLNYYTRFIGLDGKIEKRAVLVRQDRDELEEQIDQLKRSLQDVREQNREVIELAGILREALRLIKVPCARLNVPGAGTKSGERF